MQQNGLFLIGTENGIAAIVNGNGQRRDRRDIMGDRDIFRCICDADITGHRIEQRKTDPRDIPCEIGDRTVFAAQLDRGFDAGIGKAVFCQQSVGTAQNTDDRCSGRADTVGIITHRTAQTNGLAHIAFAVQQRKHGEPHVLIQIGTIGMTVSADDIGADPLPIALFGGKLQCPTERLCDLGIGGKVCQSV